MHNHMYLRNYIHIHKNVEIPSMMALTSAIWPASPSTSFLCLLSGLLMSSLLSIRQRSTKLSLHLLPFLLFMCPTQHFYRLIHSNISLVLFPDPRWILFILFAPLYGINIDDFVFLCFFSREFLKFICFAASRHHVFACMYVYLRVVYNRAIVWRNDLLKSSNSNFDFSSGCSNDCATQYLMSTHLYLF